MCQIEGKTIVKEQVLGNQNITQNIDMCQIEGKTIAKEQVHTNEVNDKSNHKGTVYESPTDDKRCEKIDDKEQVPENQLP